MARNRIRIEISGTEFELVPSFSNIEGVESRTRKSIAELISNAGTGRLHLADVVAIVHQSAACIGDRPAYFASTARLGDELMKGGIAQMILPVTNWLIEITKAETSLKLPAGGEGESDPKLEASGSN